MPTRWSAVRRTLGIPNVRAEWRLTTAVTLDTIGAGAFLPISFVFLTATTGVPLTRTGLAITAATLAALAVVPLTGASVDRWGARQMVIASSLISISGYSAYPFLRHESAIFGAVFVVMAADRLYWGAWPTYVSEVARPEELTKWYSFVHAINSGSFGLGALLAALAMATRGQQVLYALLLLKIGGSLASAALLWKAEREPRVKRGDEGGTWTTLLSDRSYIAFVCAQALISIAWIIPTSVVPLYTLRQLNLGGWVPSALFALNSLMIFGSQTWLLHRLRGYEPARLIVFGAGLLVMSVLMMASASAIPTVARVATMVAAMMTFTVGEMLCLPVANSLAAAMAPAQMRGRYLSVFQLVWAMTWGLGPGMVGLLLDRRIAVLWLLVAACILLGALAQWRLRRRVSDRTNDRTFMRPQHRTPQSTSRERG